MNSVINTDMSKTKFLISKHSSKQVYNYHPKTKIELKKLVDKLIEERGNKADLNDIDTSVITDMSGIFYDSEFNGDISNWDVSNVENMSYMFEDSNFNGDISSWNVSNVKNMAYMFYNSKFTGKNGDISIWDVSNVKDISGMFINSSLENNKPSWYH